ncbi:uncharacterized protein LOC132285939 [Cornus florida]|uniref:uncharacterized protein LOC132285939 n=1 Tax=Cornus florida TaxID=4283 RepID=UPI00289E5F67|nr:uncharacterized protein LOC132285939 [Cornus florida]
MNDSAGQTDSSLAITEKKPHRHGGCVGIFFQLFDWKRRFANKKLFSKKLLPPARAKHTSKKFGGDEKLPKLRLIADENCGGFPNAKKNGSRDVDFEQKHEMRAPSLVARLMGLEHMPTVKPEKLKKASLSDSQENFVNSHDGFIREDVNSEKETTKHELRPHKLQKTAPVGRQPLTRFRADELQFKSLLSRSTKHHSKLTSLVKSSRLPSGRNVCRNNRLIDAAANILEPRLQATSRAKYALTYLNTINHASKHVMEEKIALSPNISKNSGYFACAAKQLKEQSSCKNCGNLLDVVESRTNVEERPSVFASPVPNYVNTSSQGSERSQPRLPMSSLEEEGEKVLQKSREQSASMVARKNIQIRAAANTNRKPLNQEGQLNGHLESKQGIPQKDVPSSIVFKHKTPMQNHMPLGRNRVPPQSKLSNPHGNTVSSAANAVNGTKDLVRFNRSGHTRTRITANVNDLNSVAERKSCNRGDDSISSLPKRRPINPGSQSKSYSSDSSTDKKRRLIRCDEMTGKGMGLDSHSMNSTCIKGKLVHMRKHKGTAINKGNGIINSTFNFPMKHKTGIDTEMEKRGRQNGVSCNSMLQQILTADDSDGKTCFHKPFPSSGNALGALLKQQLKELTGQEEDDLANKGIPPKRATAMVHKELISVLTTERPVSLDESFQAKTRAPGTSFGAYSHDKDYFSPGSVLEASFSNDTCFSNSLDDNSEHKLRCRSLDGSYDISQPLDTDADILVSATSLNKGRNGSELVTYLLNQISEVLYRTNIADTRLKGSQLTHAKEVIFNAEMLFGNAALHNSEGTTNFHICYFLLDELETLSSLIWTNFGWFLGFEDPEEGNQFQEFLFDCVIEYLDSRYGRYCKYGFSAWTRLPSHMNAEKLIIEVVDEVRRWTDFAGLTPDELIERVISHSLGKWTDFEIEAFETGAEIGGDILQILVDEIVVDLWDCRQGSSKILCSLG